MGVSKSDVTRWITDKEYAVEPGSDKLAAIAAVLGVPVETFNETLESADNKGVSLGVCYNAYGVDTLTLDGRQVWQTDIPHIQGQGQETASWALPPLLAQYLAEALAVGLERVQGPRLTQTPAESLVNEAISRNATRSKKKPHTG
jgi:transcriptional regulator with XRE-family HTH domain